jgi:ribA/ribD-fused uncharacterized protein
MKVTNSNNYFSFTAAGNTPAPQVSTSRNYHSSITIREPVLKSSFFDSLFDAVWSFFDSLSSFFSQSIHPAKIQKLAQEKHFIHFYNHKNPISAWLGNFHPSSVTMNGFTFSCAEAAFQMQKFGNRALQAKFVGLSGDQAFRLARANAKYIRPDWHSIKEQVMLKVLQAKFTQNPHLRALLLATGKAHLVEHNEVIGRDDFWSDNRDGTGKNRLGAILMDLRAQFGGHGATPAPKAYFAFLKTFSF